MPQTTTISNTLPLALENAKALVMAVALDWLEKNAVQDLTGLDLNELDEDGRINDAIDGAVPIYKSEIKEIWFFERDALIKAYENAGIGSDPLENYGMAAIYWYLQDQIREWWNDQYQVICDRKLIQDKLRRNSAPTTR
jgi:hypothetical protein